MAVWTAPITWVNGSVTAATANTEIRDHFSWLKGFADNVTNSTAADSGTATYLSVKRGAGTNVAIQSLITGDSDYRWRQMANGDQEWGTGAGVRQFYLTKSTSDQLRLVGGFLGVERATGGIDKPAIGTYFTGDTAARSVLGIDVSERAYLEFGPGGSASRDWGIVRVAADVASLYSGDHLRFPAGSQIQFTADTYMDRPTTGRLETQQFRATDGIITKTKAGTISDSDFIASPIAGTMAVDTSSKRLYVRAGSAWMYVQLV